MSLVESVNISSTTATIENTNRSYIPEVDDGSRQSRLVFLALFIVCTLIGNICLVIVVIQNRRFRDIIHNLIVVNLCVVNLLDCLLNMPLVFGSLIAADWVYGDTMCRFNTFCMNLVIVETVLTLTALSADRFVAVKIIPSRYGGIFSPSRIYIAIAYTWLHSFGFSLPLLAGAVPSTFRAQLHLCSISDSSSVVFICLTSVICFVVPVVIMIILYAFIFKAAHKERFAVRSKLAEHNYTEKSIEKPQIWREIDLAKYSGLLFILWLVLEVPYIITAYIKQYQYSREFQDNPDIGEVDYPWVVDATFVWIRFAFSGILPILTFSWKRDMWRTWKDTILCRRSNSITDSESFAKPQALEKKKTNLSVPNVRSKDTEKIESPSALSFNVPVLFATANGIHVQTDQGNVDDSDIFYAEMPSTARLSSDLKFLKGKKLDVVSAQELAADTSDYDSDEESVDPYSLSQPVSTRQIEASDVDKVSRSSSQPDLQDRKTSSRLSNVRPFEPKLTSVSFGTDSGLDLTSTSRCQDSLDKGRNGKEVLHPITSEQEKHTFVVASTKPNAGKEVKSSKGDSAQEKNSTFVVCPEKLNSNTKSLGTTYTQQNIGTNDSKVNTDQQVTKKPPVHLEPLSSAKTEFKQTKRKNAKSYEGVATTKNHSSKQQKSANEQRTSRPGHKRQGTAESQKALLGSSSSAELQDMKAELLEIERKKTEAACGHPGGGAWEPPAAAEEKKKEGGK